MNPAWVIRTGRTVMTPVAWPDLPDLTALKADPRVFAVMLGGVRSHTQAVDELAADIAFWGRHGVGMWTVRDVQTDAFLGMVGLHQRPDGRGIALRFALRADMHGHGYASEAAGAALRVAHDRGGLHRVVAAAREDNVASRSVLGAIGMVECASFQRDGGRVVLYQSLR